MIRIGVDFGGTKIEAAALDPAGAFAARVRDATPADYGAAIDRVCALVAEARAQAGIAKAPIGVGVPGSISPRTGRMRNANSVWLNDKPFKTDLERALGQPIRLENDANCMALSEATDGAGAGAVVVFGAILGTGCGGGVIVGGRTVEGRNRIAGEWGHTPLPWPTTQEHDAHRCWCGRTNCLETWISGTALGDSFRRTTGREASAAEVAVLARQGDAAAVSALDAWIERLGRAFAVICDILDPDVIVCGGGMSNTEEIYERIGPAIERWVFSDAFSTPVLKAAHGDSTGVRGAAWLWPAR